MTLIITVHFVADGTKNPLHKNVKSAVTNIVQDHNQTEIGSLNELTNPKKDHNYVETPEEIIDFIGSSIKHIMKEEFGKDLKDSDVTIIDPFAGEGQFFNRLQKDLDGDSTKLQYEIEKSRYDKAKRLDKIIKNCHTEHVDTMRDK